MVGLLGILEEPIDLIEEEYLDDQSVRKVEVLRE